MRPTQSEERITDPRTPTLSVTEDGPSGPLRNRPPVLVDQCRECSGETASYVTCEGQWRASGNVGGGGR